MSDKIKETTEYILCTRCSGHGTCDEDENAYCKDCKGEGNLTAILHISENIKSIRLPRKIVARIINNLKDRRGLRQEFEQIDDDVKIELLYTLEDIVRRCIGES